MKVIENHPFKEKWKRFINALNPLNKCKSRFAVDFQFPPFVDADRFLKITYLEIHNFVHS